MYCLEPIRNNLSQQILKNCNYCQQLGDYKTFFKFKTISNFLLLVICLIDKPYLLVLEELAPLVEWEFKTETSILDSGKLFFNQFSIVQDLNALCGCLKLTNNCFFSVLIIFVFFKYSTVQEIISSFGFSSYFVIFFTLAFVKSLKNSFTIEHVFFFM